jgi:hypothetical protein
MKLVVVIALLLSACAGCGEDKYPVAKLEDPNTCKVCHPKHYDQWSGSMHAYASEDPVFVAMNKRGQREAQLGTFCINCHAPMAVKLGLSDGTNYDPSTLPPEAKGITCYFCHDVDKVNDDHNNGLVLAMDQTMRGGAGNPADTPAHDSLNDTNLMAGASNKSTMCGSCHDIITPAGVHIERSFEEWKTTIFNPDNPNGAKGNFLTCSACHMISSTGAIAEGAGLNVGSRTYGFHDHSLPAIDQAMTPFPNMDAQAAGVQTILDGAIKIVGPTPVAGPPASGGICLDPPGTLSVRTDNITAGHMFPSGASQDRRVWVEVIAYDASGTKIFSSGEVGDTQDPEDLHEPELDCANPQGFQCSGFWDRMTKDDGTPAHFFWDVRNEQSFLIKPAITTVSSDPAFDHSTTVKFNLSTIYPQIDKITARVRTRPFPYAVLDELVASGDLDPALATNLKTLESAGATATWTKATSGMGQGSHNTNCNPNPAM